MNQKFNALVLLFLFLFMAAFVNAASISINEQTTANARGISLISPEAVPAVNSSNVTHNQLSGLQGGTAGEYYHLAGTVYSTLLANINSWVTSSTLASILANIHDQDLNTTSNVTFNTLDVTCDGSAGGNETPCVNISGDIVARDIHARDVYVSNNTLYIGDNVRISASGAQGSLLNISGGNVTVGNDGYYFGSGKYLTDLNLTNISFSGDTIDAITFNGQNFNGGEFSGNFSGLYDWIAETPWLSFNGTYLFFNESYFNDSIRQQAEVSLKTYTTTMTTSGGTASTTTSILDFEIKQITVVPTTPTTNYRFEATETTTGDYVDKDRTAHSGTWDIEKNYALNNSLDLSITNANNDELFTITIKYLDNFN